MSNIEIRGVVFGPGSRVVIENGQIVSIVGCYFPAGSRVVAR